MTHEQKEQMMRIAGHLATQCAFFNFILSDACDADTPDYWFISYGNELKFSGPIKQALAYMQGYRDGRKNCV